MAFPRIHRTLQLLGIAASRAQSEIVAGSTTTRDNESRNTWICFSCRCLQEAGLGANRVGPIRII